ncbi:MAG: tRNA (adenosine(37)-N6)-dimethylallyltransferase MiaA, partial [Gemmatimonadetes bacterium]|nr:tRNA (adenosine(37)-N6)-dimethylallyltransferase MiaA [Gemmatimonadota bacterium]
MKLRLAVIVGPTACGKTWLGVRVAHRLGSEIVSADSRQVYRGLDIGTGKDLEEYARVDPPVPYHLIDVADVREIYSLYHYQRDCYALMQELARRPPFADGKGPVLLVGGSGLYVEAVLREYRIADVPEDAALRERLMQE